MKLYNTLTKKIEDFIPNKEGYVKMYTCGPTVYHFAHIGNLRTYISEDILEKALKYVGYKVDRVDGYYSKATEEALKAFEKRYGLAVNGIYDKNDATIVLSALLYHIYQELEDAQYLKVTELIK